MLKNLKTLFVTLTLSGLLTACASAPKVSADFDTNFGFNNMNSYQWAPANGGEDPFLSLYGKRVENAIESNLANKGKTIAGSVDAADFLVHYHVSVETKINIDTYYDNWGYHGYWGGYYGHGYGHPGMARSTSRVREYKEGTLVIDIIDTESKTVVWRGSSEGTLKKKMSPQERDARIQEVVTAILAEFPPVVKS